MGLEIMFWLPWATFAIGVGVGYLMTTRRNGG